MMKVFPSLRKILLCFPSALFSLFGKTSKYIVSLIPATFHLRCLVYSFMVILLETTSRIVDVVLLHSILASAVS
jgi:hypothetical protein